MKLLLIDDEATLHGEYKIDIQGPDVEDGYVILDIGDGFYHDMDDLEEDIKKLHFNQGIE